MSLRYLILILTILLTSGACMAHGPSHDEPEPEITGNWQFIPRVGFSDGDGSCVFHGEQDYPPSCGWEVCSNAGLDCADAYILDQIGPWDGDPPGSGTGHVFGHNCTVSLPARTLFVALCKEPGSQ
jgi:hypothetical protein